MEEEEEEMDVDADEEWDGPEWMLPYQGADPLNPPPPASDSESEIEFEELVRLEVSLGAEGSGFIAARDATTASATDINDDSTYHEETSPSEHEFSRIGSIGCYVLYHFVNHNATIIMPPKAMSQAAIERLITQRVNAAVEAERARQVNARGQGSNANEAGIMFM
ncbi:hypothetical protein Tco_0459074 [Tanacetum coccineum]